WAASPPRTRRRRARRRGRGRPRRWRGWVAWETEASRVLLNGLGSLPGPTLHQVPFVRHRAVLGPGWAGAQAVSRTSSACSFPTRLTFENVMSVVALDLALGRGAYAVTALAAAARGRFRGNAATGRRRRRGDRRSS